MSIRMRLISGAGAGIIRLLGFTWRIRKEGAENEERARERFPHVIYAFWHGRLLPLSFAYRNRSVQVLASRHRDGEMLGQTIRRLGFGHVRGSSTRGGTQAILALVDKLQEGYDLGITVDGPRGPRYRAKPGPVQVAKMSGAAIVPITASSRRHKTFSSWDAFELPHAFTEVWIRCGEPVVVPANAGPEMIEEKRVELENKLNQITRECDEVSGD